MEMEIARAGYESAWNCAKKKSNKKFENTPL